MAWEWGECRDPARKQCVWCKLCGHKMSRGITRLKQHLTHTGGQVKGCSKVSVDIQQSVLASIKEKEKV
ncbi:putative transcription factor/ chromatin remodeling BED-type(Zn) family [Helianthus annuus]|nr:putative transcription factor/ chromatin remodeling BED-type(Zn) family [Helianthus annuus]